MPYDWLSLNTGPVTDREKIEAQMPGAREHALFVRPIEAFGQLWPQVMAMAQQQKIYPAVVGAGAAGLELAMAAAHALGAASSAPGSRVTLLSGAQAPGASYPAGVQRRIARALQRLRIEVLLERNHSDWQSGYARNPVFFATELIASCAYIACARCLFDAKNIVYWSERMRSRRLRRPGRRRGQAGQRPALACDVPLLANLRAAWQGQPLKPYLPQQRMTCCRAAVAVWGGLSVEGAWVWRWKDRID